MSKSDFSIILILCFCWIILKNVEYSYWGNYPKINLPEQAHNTIGNIPIVEYFDDGKIITPDKKETGRGWGYTGVTGTTSVVSSDGIFFGGNQ